MERQHEPNGRFRIPSRWVLIGFLAIAGYFLFTEHRAHIIQYVPYLLLLACPLLHMFHRGHGRHRHADNNADREDQGSRRERAKGEPQ